jgi:hypothetical protein
MYLTVSWLHHISNREGPGIHFYPLLYLAVWIHCDQGIGVKASYPHKPVVRIKRYAYWSEVGIVGSKGIAIQIKLADVITSLTRYPNMIMDIIYGQDLVVELWVSGRDQDQAGQAGENLIPVVHVTPFIRSLPENRTRGKAAALHKPKVFPPSAFPARRDWG